MAEGFITRRGGKPGVDVSDATAVESDVLQGQTFYAGDEDIKTGTIPSKTAETFTPGTTNQIITAGQFLSGDQTIEGDADLIPENIREGTTIFNVTGTLTPAFNPLDIDDLEAWYDAFDLSLSNNDTISQWNDKSGNGRHVVQATSAQRPTYKSTELNGNPSIFFDGVNSNLRLNWGVSLSQPNTVFVVGNILNATNDIGNFIESRATGGSNVAIRHIMGSLPNNNYRVWSGVTLSSDNDTRDTDFHIFTGVFNTSNSKLIVDGNELASGNAGTEAWQPITLGFNQRTDRNNQALEGHISEVIVYSKLLSSSEIQQVENYLSIKWGISL